MNVYDILHQDHEKVNALFQQMEDTDVKDGAKRNDLFRTITYELNLHATAEEEFFYPELEASEETENEARNAKEDHAQIKTKLEEMEKMDKSGSKFAERFRELWEMVEEHVQIEESDLFKKARAVLDDDAAMEIADEILQFKEENLQQA